MLPSLLPKQNIFLGYPLHIVHPFVVKQLHEIRPTRLCNADVLLEALDLLGKGGVLLLDADQLAKLLLVLLLGLRSFWRTMSRFLPFSEKIILV